MQVVGIHEEKRSWVVVTRTTLFWIPFKGVWVGDKIGPSTIAWKDMKRNGRPVNRIISMFLSDAISRYSQEKADTTPGQVATPPGTDD